jgi:hypothetical protein
MPLAAVMPAVSRRPDEKALHGAGWLGAGSSAETGPRAVQSVALPAVQNEVLRVAPRFVASREVRVRNA